MSAQPIRRPCRAPGCREYATDGGYCAAHQSRRTTSARTYDATTRTGNPALAMAKAIRDGAAWKRFRAWFRAQHPLCCDPLGLHPDRPEPMEHVHHVQPLAERPDLALDPGNCQAVCVRCHAQLEARAKACRRVA